MIKKSLSNTLKLIAGFLIGLICLWLALRGIDFAVVKKIFLSVKLEYLILFLSILVMTVVGRSLLYYRFIGRIGKPSLFSIFKGIMIGYMVNSIFPLRAGDIVKACVIGKLNGVSKTYTFTITIIERLFDMFTLLLFFLLLLFTFDVDARYRAAAKMVAIFVTAVIVLIILTIRWGDRCTAWMTSRCSFIGEALKKKILEKVETVQSGLKILCDWRDLVFIQLLWLAIWGGYLAVAYITGLAISLHLSFELILFLLVTVTFGTAVVATPGQLGVHQYACIMVFSYFHLTREEALSFSLIQNTLSFILPIVLGVIFLFTSNMSLFSITGGLNEEGQADGAGGPGGCKSIKPEILGVDSGASGS
jgi:uncharacterized protein (TIRG00374 family)